MCGNMSPAGVRLAGDEHSRGGGARTDLGDALKKAASDRRQLEIAAIRSAPLDQSRIDSLTRDIQTSWRDVSLVRGLFERVDRVGQLKERPESRHSEVSRLVSDLERQYLVERGTEASLDFVSKEIARRVARQEFDHLAQAVRGAAMVDVSGADLKRRLNDVLTDLATTSQILAVLTPMNIYIDIALGLLGLAGSPQEESPLLGRAGVGQWYRGLLNDVPVVHNQIVPTDRIIVVAARCGRYEEWTEDSDTPLDIEIEETETPQRNIRLTATRWAMVTVEEPGALAAFQIDDLDLRPTFGSSGG
jgi:hypothetical protein